jgi:hypothetical protein
MANLPPVVCKNFESPAKSTFLISMEILSDGLAWAPEQRAESSQFYFQHDGAHEPYLRELLAILGIGKYFQIEIVI